MNATTTARGIAGSLRQLGATAAVVAGIAGFVAMGAAPASAAASAAQGGDIPQKACQNMDRANVPDAVYLKHGCIVIPDEGEIIGGSIFS